MTSAVPKETAEEESVESDVEMTGNSSSEVIEPLLVTEATLFISIDYERDLFVALYKLDERVAVIGAKSVCTFERPETDSSEIGGERIS